MPYFDNPGIFQRSVMEVMECSSHCMISGDTWVWLVPLLCILALITFLLMFHPLILASVNDSCLSNYHCDVCEVLIFLIPESLPHLAVSVTLSKNTFLQHFIIIDLFILIYSYGFLFYVLLTIKFHYFSNAKHVQYLANGWLFNLALFILMCPIILQAVPLWPTPHDFPVLSFLFFSQS